MITDVYNCLLHEAKTSPLLLSDLAGLETYISESYSNRSFIEMLQNADDAASTHFYIERHNQYLIIANNGRVFDINDIESLCRSASSKKNRGSSIGYRGIGFKSVVSIANEVHLISGTYQITFSRELTKQLLPNATNIPLIRIPHPIRISIFNEIKDHINTLRKRGLNTFFIFTGVKMEQIEDEYLSFPQTSLLFLRNIRFVEIHLKNKKVVKLNLSSISDYVKKITIKNEKEESNWEVYTKENCSIAFNIKDNRISKLPKNESLLHAFLPTEDISGLGVIINADFSTDPSRRHIIFDDSTKDVIKQVAKLYHEMLQEHIIFPSEHSNEYVDSLTPYFDIRLIHLTKNYFEKSFSFELKSLAERTLIDLKICPRWLNIRDFVLIVNKTSTANINEDCYSVEGFQSLLKYFGSLVSR